MSRIAATTPSTPPPVVESASTARAIRRRTGTARAVATSTVFAGPRSASLDSIRAGFATMQDRFKPAAAKGLDIRMQFELTGEGGGSWFVVIKDGRCTVTPGRGEDPDTTLQASAADYLKISNGEMNKVVALLRGKLRVKGDMGTVRPFFACFEKRRA